jgi:hypothetical protein
MASALDSIKAKHKALAHGVISEEPIVSLCIRIDFPLETAQRLLRSPTFNHLLESLRGTLSTTEEG